MNGLRAYVRCTLDGGRSGGSRRHVSDVPIADIGRTSPNHPRRTLAIIEPGDGSCPVADIAGSLMTVEASSCR